MLLVREILQTPLLWLLAFVPLPLIGHALFPALQTLLFILSIIAVVPLAGLLSLATEQVAARTGDAAGVPSQCHIWEISPSSSLRSRHFRRANMCWSNLRWPAPS